VHADSAHDREVQLTIEVMVDLANALRSTASGTARAHRPTRTILDDAGFTGASGASVAALDRLESAIVALLPLIESLVVADLAEVVGGVNDQLRTLTIAPSLTDHAGSGLHVHWTGAATPFDVQVLADIVMALATELCDHGTARFGRCAAVDCDDLFYDATRNGSRRFCDDPRCASRTHTAEHRARRRATTPVR
jgi:predicted RNA-binding Zn ribbon-like protein